MSAEKLIRDTRARLIDRAPFYAMLVMPLTLEETSRTKTMDVDGETLRYNPEWVKTRKQYQLDADLAEEGLHCGLRHPFRCKGRDAKEWNIACDYVIRAQLVKDGFKIDDFVTYNEYFGLSADAIYALRQAEKRQEEKEKGQEGPPEDKEEMEEELEDSKGPSEESIPDMGGQTSFSPAPPDADSNNMGDSDWQVAAMQASYIANKAAKGAGREPGSWEQTVNDSRHAEQSWPDVLRDWVTHNVVSDTSWSRPDRRMISQGVYLPGPVRENFGRVGVGIDKSGSMDDEALSMFQAELRAILQEVRPEATEVVWFDSSIVKTQIFTPEEEVNFGIKSGGGTMFTPVFDHFAGAEAIVGLIMFTDTDSYDLDNLIEPPCPVLWVVPEEISAIVPFGTVVKLKKYV